jgi:hypothetical protein
VTLTILVVTAALATEEPVSAKQKRGVLGLGYGYDYGLHAAAPSLPLAYAASLAYHEPLTSYHAPLSLPALPVAKVAYTAPITKLAYTAPIAKVAYAAPITYTKYAAPLNYW